MNDVVFKDRLFCLFKLRSFVMDDVVFKGKLFVCSKLTSYCRPTPFLSHFTTCTLWEPCGI
jgi:hypothetical protein